MPSYSDILDQINPDYAENTMERVLCMLVLDASGSMEQSDPTSGFRRIDLLNDGIKAFYDALQMSKRALGGVQIAAIRAGGATSEAKLLLDWTDAVDFIPFKLKAGNTTPLGAATLLALQTIETQKTVLRSHGISYLRPWLFIITDGEPTDDAATWAKACRIAREHESPASRKVTIFPINVGGADIARLSEISATKPLKLGGMKFNELFVWISGSMDTYSSNPDFNPTAEELELNPFAFVRTK